jgi:hypothetical protein
MNKERLKAELELAELEEAFLAAKEKFEDGKLSYPKYREIKQEFHDARVAFRTLRQEEAEAAADGDANARPASVKSTAKASSPGGGR